MDDALDNLAHENSKLRNSEDANTLPDRKVIRNGRVEFESANLDDTQKLIRDRALELNAYISRENRNTQDDRIWYTATLRVPSVNFEKLVESISQSAKTLDLKRINSSDVTEEFVDIEARLKAKKAVEKRYTQLLAKANGIEEIMKVEGKLGEVRESIEAAEGRLNYLKNRVSLSTLEVSAYARNPVSAGFFGKIGNALQSGWQGFLQFLIGLTYAWPFLLLILAAIGGERFYRRTRKKKLQQGITAG